MEKFILYILIQTLHANDCECTYKKLRNATVNQEDKFRALQTQTSRSKDCVTLPSQLSIKHQKTQNTQTSPSRFSFSLSIGLNSAMYYCQDGLFIIFPKHSDNCENRCLSLLQHSYNEYLSVTFRYFICKLHTITDHLICFIYRQSHGRTGNTSRQNHHYGQDNRGASFNSYGYLLFNYFKYFRADRMCMRS